MVPKDEDRDGSGQYLDLRPEMEVLAAAAVESNAAAAAFAPLQTDFYSNKGWCCKTSLRETIFGCPLLYPSCLMPELAALVPKPDWLVKSWLSCFADVVNPVLRTSVIAVKAKGSRRGCFLEVATTLFTSFYYHYFYLLLLARPASKRIFYLAIIWWCRFVKRSIKIILLHSAAE